jgi:hypothetical protein
MYGFIISIHGLVLALTTTMYLGVILVGYAYLKALLAHGAVQYVAVVLRSLLVVSDTTMPKEKP